MKGHDASIFGKNKAPPPAGQAPCSGGELSHIMDAGSAHKQGRDADSLETEVDMSGSISSGKKRGEGDEGNPSQYGEPKESSIYSTARLVSAMKGGREKSGEASRTEILCVRWAPDVYDPPVTSVDHSVKSHQQRPRSSKKDKDKQKKKSRGKRKGNRSGHDGVHHPPALLANGPSSHHDEGELETEVLDYGLSSQEQNCGSGFLSKSAVMRTHLAAAEAS